LGSETKYEKTASKGVWNTLEVAKLVLSAATPTALFVLGYIVSIQSQEREDAVREEAIARAKEARIASAKREDQIRNEAIARDLQRDEEKQQREQEFRRQTFLSEKLLRQESAAREDAIRQASIAREKSNRQQDIERQNYQRLFDKRDEYWNKIYPLLNEGDELATKAILGNKAQLLELKLKANSIRNTQLSYGPYTKNVEGLDHAINMYASTLLRLVSILEERAFETEERGQMTRLIRNSLEIALDQASHVVASSQDIPLTEQR